MTNHPNRSKGDWRVTGDHMRMTYSRHSTEAAATRAAKALAKKWGWSHPGAEPQVERKSDAGWTTVHVIGS